MVIVTMSNHKSNKLSTHQEMFERASIGVR
jgi:hypothetical protein